jgi:hypothetical protein
LLALYEALPARKGNGQIEDGEMHIYVKEHEWACLPVPVEALSQRAMAGEGATQVVQGGVDGVRGAMSGAIARSVCFQRPVLPE